MSNLIEIPAKDPIFLSIPVKDDPIVQQAIAARNSDAEHKKPSGFKGAMLQLQQSIQEEIKQFQHNVNSRAAEAQSKCAMIVDELERQNEDITNNPTQSHLGKVAERLKRDIREEVVDTQALGDGVYGRFLTARGAFREFQNKHNQHRDPRKPKNLIITIALLIALVGLEIAINSFFFDDLSNQGLIGAAFEAILFAPFNVLSASIIGYYSLRYIRHIDKNKKIMAAAVGIILTVFVVFLNSYLAALRLSLKPGNFFDIPELLSLMYSSRILEIMDFKALGITLLGLTLAVFACWKAYTLKDPYPGYEEVNRKKIEAEQDVEDLQNEYIHNIKEIGAAAKKELINRFHQNLQRITDFIQLSGDIKDERKRYEAVNSSIENAFGARQHNFHQNYISRAELQSPELEKIMAEHAITTKCPETEAELKDIPQSQMQLVSDIEANIRHHFNQLEDEIDELVSITCEGSQALFDSIKAHASQGR